MTITAVTIVMPAEARRNPYLIGDISSKFADQLKMCKDYE